MKINESCIDSASKLIRKEPQRNGKIKPDQPVSDLKFKQVLAKHVDKTEVPLKQPVQAGKQIDQSIDSFMVERESKFVSAIKSKILETPEVRSRRIEEIKRKIENNTYRVDSRKIADKMVETGIVDDLLRPI